MTAFVNFREVGGSTRLKMKLRNAAWLQTLEDAEHRGGPIWFDRDKFPGCLDHLTPVVPKGAGQLIRLK